MARSRWKNTLSRLARPLAWAIPAVVGAAFVADLIVVLTLPAAVPSSDVTRLSSLATSLPAISITVVATVLALRRPSNPAGWLLGAMAILGSASGLGSDYLFHYLYGHDLPQAPLTPLVLASVSASPASFYPLTTLGLFFPDGHLLSKRWRAAVWLNVALAALAAIPPLFDPTSIGDGHRQLPNPIGVAGAHPLASALSNVGALATFVAGIIGLVCLALRYRRAAAEPRQQIKWFGAGVVVLMVAVIVGSITAQSSQWTTPVPIIAGVIAYSAVPVCIGVAVMKYRLYDLDFVISRTIVYATLAALITAVYVAIAVGLGELVGGGGKPNLGLSILATAIVAVGFQPVRERVQRLANRVVYGQRATPYEVLSRFSEHVAESFAGDEVLARMARVLAEGTGAESATVWLRAGAELRAAATFPSSANGVDAVAAGESGAVVAGATRSVEVRHQGEQLGALSIDKRRGEPLTPIEEKLIDDLAHQAGLVLKNVRLTSDLQARLDELRASRQRLVSAQDEERRRLERNLHDGAQQHLVAIKVKLGLAELLAARDPEKAKATLAQLKGDADEALETLRDLARGIYPPLLADKGLGAALESQARKATLPVSVDAEGIGRYPQEVEAAVYFCCLEALQNVQKYASASRVRVRLRVEDGALLFDVADDGCGFDATSVTPGSGLTNMSDRLDALGGSMRVTSRPGQGTTVSGAIPVAVAAAAAL